MPRALPRLKRLPSRKVRAELTAKEATLVDRTDTAVNGEKFRIEALGLAEGTTDSCPRE